MYLPLKGEWNFKFTEESFPPYMLVYAALAIKRFRTTVLTISDTWA